jgi:hypothetical protein
MAMKKGVFFTVMSLLVVAFLLTSQKIGTEKYSPTKADTDAAHIRIVLLNRYIDTFEQQAGNSLSVAGYYSMRNISARVRANGVYATNMNASLRSCLTNRTDPLNCLLYNQTINYSLARLASIGSSNFSITTTYYIEDVWVSEEQPFEVVLWMNLSYNISDAFASWQTNSIIRSTINVRGIEDPAFAYANAAGTYTARRNFLPTNVLGYAFNNTTFTQYYLNNEYIAMPLAPSVLQRYQGELHRNSSCCGVESIIRPPQVNPAILANPAWVNWSSVDYQFFMRSMPVFIYDCSTNEIASLRGEEFPDHYVRLDREHLYNVYAVNGSANFTCLP